MTAKSSFPYEHQQSQHFWKTAVAQVNLGSDEFTLLTDKIMEYNQWDIASVGSCFAQHVGKWLVKNNFRFVQSKLETSKTSSFAFGNIYTPRCFLQWLTLSNEDNHQYDIYECQETGIYFDLLRPSVYPQGLASRSELESARLDAHKELINSLAVTSTFIFTLGLTEAWKDINGIFYPNCPGTIAGRFDPNIYQLHEFNYNEILSDLLKIYAILKELNPSINVILTVSPVPLTATATDKHVLVASHYSKAVLRAAAGYLADSHDDISYFPSFEIISVNASNDFRFEENRRTVSPKGVEYVMRHFKSVLNIQDTVVKSTDNSPNHEVQCEEEQLEAYNLLSKSVHSEPAINITLVGDSHMGKLSTALKAMNVPVAGGMIMNGSGFAQKKFAICPSEYFVPLENAPSRQLWANALRNIQAHETVGDPKHSVIISNIGLQTHQTVSRFVKWLEGQVNRFHDPFSLQNFVDFFHEDQSQQLSILIALKDNGHNVIVVSDPPFSKYFDESKSVSVLVNEYHKAFNYVCSQFDIPFLDAASLFDEEITEPMDYACNIVYADGDRDWIHGNDMYYEWLAKKLVKFIEPVQS